MAKLILNDITNITGSETSSINKINSNNDAIEIAFENTLSRDGTSPNTMEAALDMNSNRIINIPNAISNQEPVTLSQLTDTLDGIISQDYSLIASQLEAEEGTSNNRIMTPLRTAQHVDKKFPSLTDSGSVVNVPGTLTVGVDGGLNQAINVARAKQGTPGALGGGLIEGWSYNRLLMNDTGIDCSSFPSGSQTSNTLYVGYKSSGARAIGTAINATALVYGTPAFPSNALNQYVAGHFLGQTSVNLGGTNTTNNAVGAVFGLGGGAIAADTATNLLNVCGCELNSAIATGCSSKAFSLLALATHDAHAVSGTSYDTALSISAIGNGGTLGLNNGILFSNYNGQHAIKSTGKLIATQGSATVGYGIDLSSYNITNEAFKSNGFFVEGTYGGAHLRVAAPSGYEAIRSQSGDNFVDLYSNGDTEEQGLLTIGTNSIKFITASGTATLFPSGDFNISGSLTLGSPLAVNQGGTASSLASGTALDNITGFASTGTLARTGSGAYAFRTLTGPAAGILVSNGDGVSGNPTLSLINDLSALEALSSTGIAVRTTTDTWAQRTITGTSNRIAVTDGNGVSGNPTLDISSSYAGQNTITTVGTLTTGATGAGFTVDFASSTINGTLPVNKGGTGVTTSIGSGSNLLGSEGNWSPTLKLGGSTTGITYAFQTGTYVRIGSLVFAQGAIILSSKGSATGAVTIENLPFEAVLNSGGGSIQGDYYAGVTGPILPAIVSGTGKYMYLAQQGSPLRTFLTDANLTDDSTFLITLIYQT